MAPIEDGHSEFSPRLTVTRHWTSQFMTYASVARGFRGGGFNVNPRAPFRSYDGDSVWTYEAGSKWSSDDRRLSLAGAVFYNDYKNYIGLNTIAPAVGGGFATIDLNTGDVKSYGIELEGVFIQIGLVPNTDWLKGVVELTKHGEIVVDARGQTSVPGVFAAGDVTTVPFKQIIIAAGDGAKAALGAFDHLIRTSAPVEQAAA